MKTAMKRKPLEAVLSDEKLAERMLRRKEVGKEGYSGADADLAELLKRGYQPGDMIKLPDGQLLTFIDNFEGKNKAWKPTGINRFDVKVSRASDVTSKL